MRKSGTNLRASVSQDESTESGQITRDGPCSAGRSCFNQLRKDSVWSVLPKPISSPRMAPQPSS